MSLIQWGFDTVERIRNDGFDGLRDSAYEFRLGALRRLRESKNYDEVGIFDRNWDVLLILDGCRYDTICEVSNLDVDSVYSVGSCTPEWMKQTFRDAYSKEMSETIYVTANMWSETHVDETDLAGMEEVWRWGWNDDLDTVHPDEVTKAAIANYRDNQPKRMVVHYIQPHYPFIGHQFSYGDRRGDGEYVKVWDRLRRGEIDRDAVLKGYRENLQVALEAVDKLLSNIDAEDVVITSDHGNAIGESGVYGHPSQVSIESLRKVPWVETTATNTEKADIMVERMEDSTETEEKLKHLGYL